MRFLNDIYIYIHTYPLYLVVEAISC